ncbi:LacI family DNA-binding transcriptional regulator [Rhodanobacter sp. 115]|uniref:LacI family DNA-binding transcriptional regulator n=1 Tax=Rhodanobacter sp. FW021-MT20 TaxID=1162282 RepID=UPI00068066BC|nr:LacI family DNA-binding transcriptional regulator [Rhodanobacter sp. 115]
MTQEPKEQASGTPTLQDVATRAGVSSATVSRVINGGDSVRKETRSRVMRAIELLDYRPNLFARGLSGARAYTIGLAYDNPNAYLIVAALQGALTACDDLGFGLHVHPFNSSAPNLAEKLRDFSNRLGLAGIVLAPPVSERSSALMSLRDCKIPVALVLSSSADPGGNSPCVYIDDRNAAYSITAHLIHLGHRRIGFLKGGKSHHASAERFDGYREALRDYNVVPSEELIVQGDYLFDDGFRGARRLLSLARPPTAIFGSNDEIAAGALAAARSDGLQIPHDISIAGFEDSPFSRQSWPPLTTARQPEDLIIERATRLLIAHIRGGKVENEGFKPELVVRGSTAPPRREA